MTFLTIVIGNQKLESGEKFSDDRIGLAFLKEAFIKKWESLFIDCYIDLGNAKRNAEFFIHSVEYPSSSYFKWNAPRIYQVGEKIAELFGYENTFWEEFKKSIL